MSDLVIEELQGAKVCKEVISPLCVFCLLAFFAFAFGCGDRESERESESEKTNEARAWCAPPAW